MKKLTLWIVLLLLITSLCACQSTEPGAQTSSAATTEPVTTEPEAPPVPEITIPYSVFPIGDTMTVSFSGTDENDWFGLYAPGVTPGSEEPLVRFDAVGEGTLSISTTEMTAGTYGFFLLDNGGTDILARGECSFVSPETADFGALDASFSTVKDGKITRATLRITPRYASEATYQIAWSKNGVRLEGYSPLATLLASGSEPFDVALNDMLFMPEQADGVEITVLKGQSTPFYLSVDDSMKAPASELVLKFEVLSDLHVIPYQTEYVANVHKALADIREIAPDSEAIFTVGDNTHEGKKNNYKLLLQIIEEELTDHGVKIPFRYAIGNHDLDYNGSFEDQLALFLQYTEMPGLYYASEYAGMKFLVLGSQEKKARGVMHEDQFLWLKDQLEQAGTEKPIFLFMHEPLVDTVAGSLYSYEPASQYWYGFENINDSLRELLRQYPNIILFTGHTHYEFESFQPILYGNGQDATFIGVPAVGYLENDDNEVIPGAQGWYIEIYKDYILLKGREYTAGEWVGCAQYLFPLG